MSREPTEEAIESGLAALPGAAEPDSVDACLTAAELAAWAEGACANDERDRVAGHVAACAACLAELSAAPRWLDAPPRPVPDDLARRAAALGARRSRPAARRWLAVAAGVALASAATPLLRAPESSSPAHGIAERPGLSRPVGRRGEGFARRRVGQPRHLRVTGSLSLTPRLRDLVGSASTDPADHAPLLAFLEASRLRIPTDAVTRVEIGPGLVDGAAAAAVRVTLDFDGMLAIRGEP